MNTDQANTEPNNGDALPDRLLTVRDVAAYLRISRDSVFALLRTGELRSLLIRKRGRRITREQLAEYIRNRQNQS